MSASVMMNLRSTKLTLGTQITKARIVTQITKIETRTIVIIIPATAPATQ